MPSPRVLAEGVQLCLRNAESYILSAEILFNSTKYKEAYILNGFAQEELGKILNISNALHYADNGPRWSSWKKRFKDHVDKLRFGEDVDNIMKNELPNADNKEVALEKFIDRLEQMYVNYDGEKFVMPNEILEEEIIKDINQTKERFKFHKDRHTSIEDDEKLISEQYTATKDKSYAELTKMAEDKLTGH